MERPSTGLRASKFLPLMVFAQAQLSSAYPFAPRINAETGDLEAGPQPHFAPNHVVPRPEEGLDTTAWPTTSCTDENAAHWTGLPVVPNSRRTGSGSCGEIFQVHGVEERPRRALSELTSEWNPHSYGVGRVNGYCL